MFRRNVIILAALVFGTSYLYYKTFILGKRDFQPISYNKTTSREPYWFLPKFRSRKILLFQQESKNIVGPPEDEIALETRFYHNKNAKRYSRRKRQITSPEKFYEWNLNLNVTRRNKSASSMESVPENKTKQKGKSLGLSIALEGNGNDETYIDLFNAWNAVQKLLENVFGGNIQNIAEEGHNVSFDIDRQPDKNKFEGQTESVKQIRDNDDASSKSREPKFILRLFEFPRKGQIQPDDSNTSTSSQNEVTEPVEVIITTEIPRNKTINEMLTTTTEHILSNPITQESSTDSSITSDFTERKTFESTTLQFNTPANDSIDMIEDSFSLLQLQEYCTLLLRTKIKSLRFLDIDESSGSGGFSIEEALNPDITEQTLNTIPEPELISTVTPKPSNSGGSSGIWSFLWPRFGKADTSTSTSTTQDSKMVSSTENAKQSNLFSFNIFPFRSGRSEEDSQNLDSKPVKDWESPELPSVSECEEFMKSLQMESTFSKPNLVDFLNEHILRNANESILENKQSLEKYTEFSEITSTTEPEGRSFIRFREPIIVPKNGTNTTAQSVMPQTSSSISVQTSLSTQMTVKVEKSTASILKPGTLEDKTSLKNEITVSPVGTNTILIDQNLHLEAGSGEENKLFDSQISGSGSVGVEDLQDHFSVVTKTNQITDKIFFNDSGSGSESVSVNQERLFFGNFGNFEGSGGIAEDESSDQQHERLFSNFIFGSGERAIENLDALENNTITEASSEDSFLMRHEVITSNSNHSYSYTIVESTAENISSAKLSDIGDVNDISPNLLQYSTLASSTLNRNETKSNCKNCKTEVQENESTENFNWRTVSASTSSTSLSGKFSKTPDIQHSSTDNANLDIEVGNTRRFMDSLFMEDTTKEIHLENEIDTSVAIVSLDSSSISSSNETILSTSASTDKVTFFPNSTTFSTSTPSTIPLNSSTSSSFRKRGRLHDEDEFSPHFTEQNESTILNEVTSAFILPDTTISDETSHTELSFDASGVTNLASINSSENILENSSIGNTETSKITTVRNSNSSSTTESTSTQRFCSSASQCNVTLNERCFTSGEHKICGCAKSFVRHPETRKCERSIKLTTTLKLPGETFHEDLLNPKSVRFQAKKRNAIQAMRLLLQNDRRLLSRMTRVDVSGFEPGSLVVTWDLVLAADVNDSVTALVAQLNQDIQDAFEDRDLLKELPLNVDDAQILSVTTSSEPCADPRLNYCSPHAECLVDLERGFRCLCPSGFRDDSADANYPGEVCVATCPPEFCGNHGSCEIKDNDEKHCLCHGWYLGSQCQISGVLAVASFSAVNIAIIIFVFWLACFCKNRRKRRSRFNVLQESEPRGCTRPVAEVALSDARGRRYLPVSTPLPQPLIKITSPSFPGSSISYDDSTFDRTPSICDATSVKAQCQIVSRV